MSSRPERAALYMRMSTDQQKYSIEHQDLQLRAHAEVKGYEVSAIYKDEGKSGLSLKGRPALRELIRAVVSGTASFDRILVLDVSRWGRFQDPDQSAHLEFLCREAGVPVEYVGEPFNEWTGPAASIVKSIKRIMAAEYSRELSERTKFSQLHHAAEGFKQGGAATFGVRRCVVDSEGVPGQLLGPGERKCLTSERVRLVRGPPEELDAIKRIFQEYGVEGRSVASIVRRLNKDGVGQRRWSTTRVLAVLNSVQAQGIYRYNQASSPLGSVRRKNPPEVWVESKFAEPLIETDVYAASMLRRETAHRTTWTDDELIDGLKALLQRKGRLSMAEIDMCPFTPSRHVYMKRFGGLRAAYALAGFTPGRRFPRPPRRFSDEAIIDDLKMLLCREGRLSIQLVNASPTLPPASKIRKRFGSLERAFELAGYGLAERAEDMRERCHRRQPNAAGRRRRLSDEDLIAPLRRLYADHGRITVQMIEDDPGCASLPTYQDRFGSLIAAYKLAGWNTSRGEINSAAIRNGKRHPYSPAGGWAADSIANALRKGLKRHGRLTCGIIKRDHRMPSLATVQREFGTVSAAYAAIGYDPRANVD